MSARIYRFTGQKKRGRKVRRASLPSCPVYDLASHRARVQAEQPSAQAQAFALYQQAAVVDETDPASAIPLYERAIELDPSLAIAVTNLGNCHHRLHNEAEAIDLYERALAIQPHPEVLYNLGYCRMHQGRTAEAVDLFKRSLEMDPVFADAWFNLGIALENGGMPNWALPVQHAFKRYIALATNDPTWVEIAKRHLVAN